LKGTEGREPVPPFPRLQTTNLSGLVFPNSSEACDDVCEFVSVASFGVTREDNSLLLQLFSLHTKIERNWQVVVMTTKGRQTSAD
jgi:hypothetical protein